MISAAQSSSWIQVDSTIPRTASRTGSPSFKAIFAPRSAEATSSIHSANGRFPRVPRRVAQHDVARGFDPRVAFCPVDGRSEEVVEVVLTVETVPHEFDAHPS